MEIRQKRQISHYSGVNFPCIVPKVNIHAEDLLIVCSVALLSIYLSGILITFGALVIGLLIVVFGINSAILLYIYARLQYKKELLLKQTKPKTGLLRRSFIDVIAPKLLRGR